MKISIKRNSSQSGFRQLGNTHWAKEIRAIPFERVVGVSHTPKNAAVWSGNGFDITAGWSAKTSDIKSKSKSKYVYCALQ